MMKKTITATCDAISINKTNSTARFVVEIKQPLAAAPAAGHAPQRIAKTVITALFDSPEGVKDFAVNKETEITFSQK